MTQVVYSFPFYYFLPLDIYYHKVNWSSLVTMGPTSLSGGLELSINTSHISTDEIPLFTGATKAIIYKCFGPNDKSLTTV